MKIFTYIKSFLALVVIVAFMAQTLELPVKKAWKLVHQESFESRYCMNLEYPQLDCHGSCHIQQIASAHTDYETNQAQINTVQLSLDLFYDNAEISLNLPIILSEKAIQLPYYQGYTFTVFSDIFHPPELG